MKAPKFWQRGHGGWISGLLAPIGFLYDLGGRLRQIKTTGWVAPVPVICVGNVVAGGAGKTPVCLDIAERLKSRGRRVSFLSRGYGGSEAGPHLVDRSNDGYGRVGDEPLLLARSAPTWVARDRLSGAKQAFTDTDAIIMDDGLQDPSLHKSLSLLVIDGAFGVGNGRVLPAGPLRESLAYAVSRASAVVIVGPDEAGVGQAVKDLRRNCPQLLARINADTENLRGKKLYAFAGIGIPEKFFNSLRYAGCDVVSTRSFADHHAYSDADILALKEEAVRLNAALVTTEKDIVRIAETERHEIEVLTITLEWDDETALMSILDRLF